MNLVTGAGGLLGERIIELDENAIGLYYTRKPLIDRNLIKLDITNRKEVFKIFKDFQPKCVIHCAALTNVDYCEEHKKEAYTVNVEGTKNVVDACKEIGAKLVYVSTDFIFDGKKGSYKESDKPNPLSYYGFTKLKGEEFVRKLENYVIARTSVIYGPNKSNFVFWVLESLRKGKKIKVVTDQYNSPTYNLDLAKALLKLSEKGHGIYHTAGSERISRYEFAKRIAKIFNLDSDLIEKITSHELMQKAKRPFDSSLNVEKIKKDFDIIFSDTLNGLKMMKKEVVQCEE